jgi:hypothetical protein
VDVFLFFGESEPQDGKPKIKSKNAEKARFVRENRKFIKGCKDEIKSLHSDKPGKDYFEEEKK